ncbi:hypothetical protein ACJMK2_013895, partial [Sinanodonta woodiana]
KPVPFAIETCAIRNIVLCYISDKVVASFLKMATTMSAVCPFVGWVDVTSLETYFSPYCQAINKTCCLHAFMHVLVFSCFHIQLIIDTTTKRPSAECHSYD